MRIQHNVMAMNAYRNYTNNVSAMKKNLERLSSGYKINRAGDDAAGLAISEKMRAQITGLETAQKNAKDGISLVQTAEGALTEVHDMLNRMVELATMSANGTYDNTTDRAQLQKEMDQLNSEINRIADSANFNGIKLLNGDMDGTVPEFTPAVAETVYKDLSNSQIQALMLPKSGSNAPVTSTGAPTTDGVGVNTILETNSDSSTYKFSVRFDGMKHMMVSTTNAASTAIELKFGSTAVTGSKLTEKDLADEYGVDVGEEVTGEQLASLMAQKINDAATDGTVTVDGLKYTVDVNGDQLVFTLAETPSAQKNVHLDVDFNTDVKQTDVQATAKTVSYAFDTVTAGAATASTTATVAATINGEALEFKITEDQDDPVAANVSGADLVKALKNLKTKDSAGNEIRLGDHFNISFDSTKGFVFADKVKGVEGSGNTVDSFSVDFGDGNRTLDEVVETDGVDAYKAGLNGYMNNSTEINFIAKAATPDQLASTTLKLTDKHYVDGAKLTLGDQSYVFAVGEDSKYVGGENVVDLTAYDKTVDGDFAEYAATKLTEFIDAQGGNKTFSVGHDKTNGGYITLKQLQGVKDSTDMTTMKNFANYIGFSTVDEEATKKAQEAVDAANAEGAANAVATGKALKLQIGDTADDFNQLEVNIRDMHAKSLGLDTLRIDDQAKAAEAIDAIKAAINTVSDVRGTLGATQNRLDHTINNLGVMTENIQDAESTIRDVDVAEEMMAYTKNNILIQSAQAMLAQANQVPQGVLQLLQ